MTDELKNACPTFSRFSEAYQNPTYIQEALRTEPPDLPPILRITHAAMGLCTEAGEFMDALKKHTFYNRQLDRVNLIEELGDLFWYMAIACDELGVTFEQVQGRNIAKLKARYPDRFCSDKAQNRDLDTERQILEGTHVSQERPVL